MKTNHQRNFVAKNYNYGHSPMGGFGELSKFCGQNFGAGYGGDNSNGHRGYAKAKRGARKYVHSRKRFHEKATLDRMVRSNDFLD